MDWAFKGPVGAVEHAPPHTALRTSLWAIFGVREGCTASRIENGFHFNGPDCTHGGTCSCATPDCGWFAPLPMPQTHALPRLAVVTGHAIHFLLVPPLNGRTNVFSVINCTDGALLRGSGERETAGMPIQCIELCPCGREDVVGVWSLTGAWLDWALERQLCQWP